MTYHKIIKVLGLPDGSVRQSSAEKNKIFFVLYLTHPHVCRHTFCSNMAKSGMNPKTLQYIMGHSDIGVTLNTYTHIGFEDAQEELQRVANAEQLLLFVVEGVQRVCDTAKYESGRKFPVQSVLLLQGKDLRQSSAIEFRHISQKRASSKTRFQAQFTTCCTTFAGKDVRIYATICQVNEHRTI